MGDIYFGEHKQFIVNGKRHAHDVATYDEDQIAIVAKKAFEVARQRRKKLTSVDKSNVLDTSKLWRTVVSEVAGQYPDVQLEHMLVDNCAMQLIINPAQFDVILTANLFGDILSDELAALVGGLGLMPSANINAAGFGMYEPAGGSAHDLVGKHSANPIAQILSVALMLRYSFELDDEAKSIETAIQKVLAGGFRTQDIYHDKAQLITTEEMRNLIIKQL